MLLLENISHDELKKYMKELYDYALSKLTKIDRDPKVAFKKDKANAEDILGKTGYYDPDKEKIVLFVTDRHPKDILRSFAHELVHHEQKCRGADKDIDMSVTSTDPSYALHNEGLREMEREAFERGNVIFRDWCDTKKIKRGKTMNETKLPAKKKAQVYKKEKEIKKAIKKDVKKGAKAPKNIDATARAAAMKDVGVLVGKEEMDEELKIVAKAVESALLQESKEVKKEEVKTNEQEISHPYPQLFKQKNRLFDERFNEYEQWKYEELLKRAKK